jgi:hypothetical protein
MNPTPLPTRIFRLLPLVPCVAFLLTLAGCAYEAGYASGSVAVVASDDYVYYPGYEVYYSNTHHRYIYRDGNRWVTRPQPPRTWSREAPSVHMEFHDTPERHHTEVVRTYPRNWRPGPAHKDKDQRRDNDDRKDHDDHH